MPDKWLPCRQREPEIPLDRLGKILALGIRNIPGYRFVSVETCDGRSRLSIPANCADSNPSRRPKRQRSRKPTDKPAPVVTESVRAGGGCP